MQRAVGELRAARWLVATMAGITAVFLAGFSSSYREGGLSLKSVTFAGFVVLGCVGFVEVAVCRVVLGLEALVVISLWSRKWYPRAAIRSVKFEWGAGVARPTIRDRTSEPGY